MAGLSTRLTFTSNSLNAAFRGLSLNATTTPLIRRSFSTSSCLQKRKVLPEEIPPYPYKPNYQYKQADSGLYGGVSISFGNKISKGRNKGKTRRSWKPNVRWKKMPSEALGEELFIKLTRKALRTIRKCGGLDKYLLSNKSSRIKELGLTGWQLRYRIMQTPTMQAKFAEFREEHDLQEPPKTFEEWLKARGLFDEAKLEAIVGPIRMKSKEAEKPIQKKETSAKEEKPLPLSDNEIGKNSEQPGVL